tara:strand:+ start:110 stop:385 length:276 start_codon:yes stop_codon:yes gene_type:complete
MNIEDINRGKIVRLEHSTNWGVSVNLDNYNYNFNLDLDVNVSDSVLNAAIEAYMLEMVKHIPEVIPTPEEPPVPVVRDTLLHKLVNTPIRK